MLIASQFLLWVVVALLVVAVLALSRQLGAIRERLSPPTAARTQAPAVGDPAPPAEFLTLDGATVPIGEGASPRAALLLFVAPTSTLCRKIIPVAKSAAAATGLDLFFVGDGDPADQRRMAERENLAASAFVDGPEVALAFQVGELPYAVLIDEAGLIAARGPVNTRERLARLIASARSAPPAAFTAKVA